MSIALMAVTLPAPGLRHRLRLRLQRHGARPAAAIPFINVAHSVATWLAFFAYLAGLTSTLGVLIAAVNSQCRLIFNAGREGLLPRWIGKVHPVRRTPVNAIITFVAVASGDHPGLGARPLIGGHSGSLSALNFFFESSTMGTILILVVYFLANLALPFYYRKYRPQEFNIIKHSSCRSSAWSPSPSPSTTCASRAAPALRLVPVRRARRHRGVGHLLHLAGQARPRPGRPGRLDRRRRVTAADR
jgi:amino acid transporter